MPKTGSEIIHIMRNVTGRVDASDPQFTDTIMLGYLNDFLKLEMPQDARLYETKTWWEFQIDQSSDDPYPVDLETLGYTTIGPPAYVQVTDGSGDLTRFALFWYQSPSVFYSKWPQVTGAEQQRPQDVLYYNKELTFRGPPDQTYTIQIQANEIQAELDAPSDEISESYFWRYAAYGASLDIFTDFGEMDKYAQYYPVYMRYRSMMYARTNQQLSNQRTYPTF